MKVSVIVAVQMVALATLVRGDVNMPEGVGNLMKGMKMPEGVGNLMKGMKMPEGAGDLMKGMMGNGAGGAGGMPDIAGSIMTMADANKDGKLTKEEFEKMAGGEKGPASMGWNKMIKLADQPDCDGVLTKEELGDFINMDPTLKAGVDGKLSKEELGNDETWKTLEASGKIKDGQISVKDYIAYKVTAAKCNAASLTAALSMLGCVLLAKILF